MQQADAAGDITSQACKLQAVKQRQFDAYSSRLAVDRLFYPTNRQHLTDRWNGSRCRDLKVTLRVLVALVQSSPILHQCWCCCIAPVLLRFKLSTRVRDV
jgi:hypothetical protein